MDHEGKSDKKDYLENNIRYKLSWYKCQISNRID